MKDILADIDENEPLEVEITSEGGSVFAGVQIANMLARHKGKVTTHGVGFVASIATVILMAGKKVAVDSNCFCLIHLPWTFVQGNANDLEKEIDTLNKCKEAMMGYYRKHAKVSDEQLEEYLSNETWFLGTEFADVFDVEVVENDEQLDIAAKYDLTKYKNLPRGLNMKNEKNEAEKVEAETVETEKAEVVETEKAEEPTTEEPSNEKTAEETVEQEIIEEVIEETTEEPDVEELKKKIEELMQENAELKSRLSECGDPNEEKVTKAECEKRVSGMQASMQKQINDFKGQLEQKEKELVSAKAEITSLSQKLEDSNKELHNAVSALEEKTTALDKLNSKVNAQAEEPLPTMKEGLAKCASPAEKVAFLKSGKFVR